MKDRDDKNKKKPLEEIKFKKNPKADKIGAAQAETIAEAIRSVMLKDKK